MMFPKPVKRVKERKPLKRSRMRRGDRKTKHARREREWGFMSFCRARGCELALDSDLQRILEIEHVCRGPVQFAHLSDLKRYDVGDVGAGLCEDVHTGIDGNKVGGKPRWYVELGKVGQSTFRVRLSNRARRAWDELAPWERARWDEVGEAWRRESAPPGVVSRPWVRNRG